MTDSCHNCGQTDLEFLYGAAAFDSGTNPTTALLGLARCPSCGVVNTTGASHEEVAKTYTGAYYGSGSRKFQPVIEWAVSWTTRLQANKITRIWQMQQRMQRAPAVLDIGCGRGNLLRAFQITGAAVLGLEREEFPQYECPNDIVRVGAITDPAYADRTFDIIILWHVLEHIDKTEQLLDIVTEHLNDNGLLVIAVPNFSSLQQWIFGKYWFHLDLPRHLVHLESKWLLHRLADRGYALQSINYLDPLQNTYGFIQSALNVIAPRRQNHYYKLLTYGHLQDINTVIPLITWSLLSLLLLPIALVESALGALLRKGATVQLIAKLERKSAQ